MSQLFAAGRAAFGSRAITCLTASSTRRIPCRSASSSSSSERQQATPPPLPRAQPPLPRPPPPPTPFELLLEGKRFTCTECGKCCTGSGEIWANEAECAAIATHLRLPMLHFFRRYTKSYSRRPGWRMLKLQPGSDHCIFLEGGTKCSIYPVRPLQCSTYPWWPELMDPGEWAAEGRTVCEGIEHENALPVDVQDKAPVLRAATEYFAEQLAASNAGRLAKPRQGS
ncbi:hypothetical protein ACK3TF_002256 [Chlorella vulgaris]